MKAIDSLIKRKKTRQIILGRVKIGGNAPISVQSMTKCNTSDIKACISEINALEAAGCEIVRVAVPDRKAAYSLNKIKKKSTVPIVADIHFRSDFALIALEQGVDGLRINPGNIGGKKRLVEIVKRAKERGIPIRIGINSGSLERIFNNQYGSNRHLAMVESALRNIQIIEDAGFNKIKISLKSPSVIESISAYRILSEKTPYPLHVGITEAGTVFSGTIKSAVGIGILLSEGIGDTIRVSLSGPPVFEVKAGFQILKALKLREIGVEIISCPGCGRSEIDIHNLAMKVEEKLSGIKTPIKIAVMGCSVNGPGEARDADIGIAGDKKGGVLFKDGKITGRVDEKEILNILIAEVEKFLKGKESLVH
ncbi:MAG: flavodoxin-dependent (E)-4-hydroxy-3-methylbut-2-enyl-diphosphate synthase [Thermodesulfobacteriota bacterium]|nr:flavodoxin-dependent (E)-4-hydroxy-3-methylbut-2-enyl-diphosphate synthase [Thermodesulfobacteriota bacterium]